ncbi:MAG: hypothetical protein CBC12_05780 [Candidatus Puniceispirillum sp. TMED52]|nr:DNA-binding response regulator [SAR116 cluster bacterium]OUU50431.1 MAG: hypothetical protein CBC12_05780 [Candidatus Puniceispirillum sp. TMED52]
MIKVLAVDDDPYLLETILLQIEQEGGYDIDGATSLTEAKTKLPQMDPDLVILDVTLGDGDGRDLCRWMRDMGYTIPVLMLTAQSSEMDTIDGLEAGANDYIAKPVRIGELIARMKTHLIQHQAREDARITIGAFQFSSCRKTLVHIENSDVINLTEKEAAIIKHLHQNQDRVINKKALLEEVWGYGDGVTTHTLETHIYRLRQKIRYVDETPFLLTYEGGYQLA